MPGPLPAIGQQPQELTKGMPGGEKPDVLLQDKNARLVKETDGIGIRDSIGGECPIIAWQIAGDSIQVLQLIVLKSRE